MANLDTGKHGEDLAVAFLERQGYRIVERNFRCKGGEIDVVAVEGRIVCFVEVKARHGARFGEPFEAVDQRKRRRMVHAARLYVSLKRLAGLGCRYDIVSIRLDAEPPDILLFRDAFDEGQALGER